MNKWESRQREIREAQPVADETSLFAVSDLYQSIFNFKGSPLSYWDFPYWIPVLNSIRLTESVPQSMRRILLLCSRQVGKSVFIGVNGVGKSIEMDNFTTIITQPTDKQISRFSVDTLKKLNKDSITTDVFYYDRAKDQRQVKNKSYSNGSRIVLANIYSSVLSARGIPGDMMMIDEYQDTPEHNALIVEKSLQKSPYRYKIFSGTPLHPDNIIQKQFDISTGTTWMIRCKACGHWNGPLGLSHIGKNGLICEKCYRRINGREGQWVDARPTAKLEGFSINELGVPRDAKGATEWNEIIRIVEEEDMVTIKNELLGESYTDSKHPITTKDIASHCDSNRKYVTHESEITPDMTRFSFGGVDWAMETNPHRDKEKINSYTKLTIGHYDTLSCQLVIDFIKVYYGEEEDNDPAYVEKDIVKWSNAFDVKVLGLDYGVGHKENQRIVSVLGYERTMEFQYMGDLADFVTYDSLALKWIIMKSELITTFIDDLKNNHLYRFAKYDGETSEHATDLTCIYKYNNTHKRSTMYGKTKADDWLHGLIYLTLAFKYSMGMLDYKTR